MKFVNLTPHRMAALKALGRYQYLTLDQFLRIGISSNKSNLTNRVLIPLRDNKPALVKYVKRGAMKRDVYCLTKRGAQEVATQTNVESIRYSLDGVQYNRDFEHREGTIDFQIALDQWSKQTETPIEFVHAYYIGTGAQKGKEGKFKSQTDFILGNGDRFVPDLAFQLTMNDGESRLFAFEYHRGMIAEKFSSNCSIIPSHCRKAFYLITIGIPMRTLSCRSMNKKTCSRQCLSVWMRSPILIRLHRVFFSEPLIA